MGQPLLGQQVVYERPASELGRGKYSTSPWVVGTVVALAVLFAVAFVVVLARRRARRAANEVGPVSSRGSVRPGPPSSRSKS